MARHAATQLVPAPGHAPLRIEWCMASPWVPPARGLHLDGLLGAALVERALAKGRLAERAQHSVDYDTVLQEIPLTRFVPDGAAHRWVWAGSMLQPTVAGSERRYMTTKTPVAAIAEYTDVGLLSPKGGAKVDTLRGYYKAGSFHYSLEYATTVVAWCVGDPDLVADLLGDIYALGAKTRLGHGAIREVQGQLFTMNEDPAALEHWSWRNMPLPLDDYEPAEGALRTPYWRRDRATALWRPIG